MESNSPEQLQEEEANIHINTDPTFYRQWFPELPTDFDKTLPPNSSVLRVLQYNILSDSLLPVSTKIIEEDCLNTPYLKWENRSQKILKEILYYNAELVGLEEFERDEKIIQELLKNDYEFSFKPRTGKHSEGVAIAWKRTKLSLIELYCLEFNMNKNRNTNMSPLFDRDNVALIGVFNYLPKPNTIVIFACAHLLFNVKRGDIKLGQVYQLVHALYKLKGKYKDYNNAEQNVYVVMTGDLNCTPRSAIYKLLTEGQVDCNFFNYKSSTGQSNDNLQYINPPKTIKGYLLKYVCSRFREELEKDRNRMTRHDTAPQENVKFYNEICRIKPYILEDKSIILNYDNSYIYKDNNLILELPMYFQSAYARLAKDFVQYFAGDANIVNKYPFSLLQISNAEINSIKMSKDESDKTLKFTKNLTLDLPMTSYSCNNVTATDYIFYNGGNSDDISVLRILKTPDVFQVVFEQGYMPNEIYPSDHFLLCTDLLINSK